MENNSLFLRPKKTKTKFMNKTKSLLCLVAIFAIVLGCSKKDSPVPVCYASTITYASEGYNGLSTYTYANNRVISVSTSGNDGYTFTKTFSYDAQGKIISYTTTDVSPSSGTSVETYTLSYDANNRVSQEISSSIKNVYTYNSSGQRVKKEVYNGPSPTFTLDRYEVYTYPSTSTKNYTTLIRYDATNTIK